MNLRLSKKSLFPHGNFNEHLANRIILYDGANNFHLQVIKSKILITLTKQFVKIASLPVKPEWSIFCPLYVQYIQAVNMRENQKN